MTARQLDTYHAMRRLDLPALTALDLALGRETVRQRWAYPSRPRCYRRR